MKSKTSERNNFITPESLISYRHLITAMGWDKNKAYRKLKERAKQLRRKFDTIRVRDFFPRKYKVPGDKEKHTVLVRKFCQAVNENRALLRAPGISEVLNYRSEAQQTLLKKRKWYYVKPTHIPELDHEYEISTESASERSKRLGSILKHIIQEMQDKGELAEGEKIDIYTVLNYLYRSDEAQKSQTIKDIIIVFQLI